MKRRISWRNDFLAAIALTMLASQAMVAQNGVYVIDSLNARHGGPGPSYGFYFASCWGYVAPDGHEYALLGCYGGTSIIDLDASPIQEVAFIPGANNEWKEIKTWGHYAYAVSEGASQGLQVINLSQLPDTAWLEAAHFTIGPKNVSRNHTITVADGYLYLNGSTAGGQNGGAIILSLHEDPVNPVYVGEYGPTYFHDTYVRNDTLFGAALAGGVYIASVANKAAPTLLGRITYTGSGTHNVWASMDGKYLFTTDEVGSTAKNMKVWDIQNLPAVEQKTPYAPSPTTVIHNVHVRGNYVYIAHYKAGVFVADVHNPLQITTAGTYQTYRGGGTHTSYAGCWGVYPYYPSGRWIASDTQNGLYLLGFNSLAPRIRSTLLSPSHGDTMATGDIFRWRLAASQSEDPHYYQVHIKGTGVDTLLRTQDTVAALPAIPAMTAGASYTWHVWIRDEFTAVSSPDTFTFVYRGSPSGADDPYYLPADFTLHQNYPNPFNPSTIITVEVYETSRVSLRVYSVQGEEVATLLDGVMPAGEYRVSFDPSSAGGGLASGIYLYRLSAGNGNSITKKMAYIR